MEGPSVRDTANRPGTIFSQRPIGGCSSIYMVVAQIDHFYEGVAAHGAETFSEIDDEDYGSRNSGVLEPEGHIWSFGNCGGEGSPAG
ncbi:MAG: putative glyoxalase superfamily protein PhnB [Paracrocinitomix sp.]